MAAAKQKGFVKTSEKAYLAWVTFPGVGVRVPGTRSTTDKAAPYVLYGISGTYQIMSGNELARKFVFEDGSAIGPDSIRARLVGGAMKWTAVKRKSDAPEVWARHEPVKGALGFFTVCPDIGGEPELSNARKVRGESFVAMYNMARFPNLATREQLNATPAKPEVELASPKKISEGAAQSLAEGNVGATRYTGKFSEGLSATKSGVDAREGFSAVMTGIGKVQDGVCGGLQVTHEPHEPYTAQFTQKDAALDKVYVEIKGGKSAKWAGTLPLEAFAKGKAAAQVAAYGSGLSKLAAKKSEAAVGNAFAVLRRAADTHIIPQLADKYPKLHAVQAQSSSMGGKKLVIKPERASALLGSTICVMFPTDSGFAYRFSATAQNTIGERIVQGVQDIRPAFEQSNSCDNIAKLVAGVLKGYNAISLFDRREKSRMAREKGYDFDLVGVMKDKNGVERYILQRRGTDKKTAATREQLVAAAEAKRVSNVYVQTLDGKKKIRVLNGTLDGLAFNGETDVRSSRLSVAMAEAEIAERFATSVLTKLSGLIRNSGKVITMPEFTPAAPDGNSINSAAFECELLTSNPTKFVFDLKAHTYFVAGKTKVQCNTATEMAKGIVKTFCELLGVKAPASALKASAPKEAVPEEAVPEEAADRVEPFVDAGSAETVSPLSGVRDDFDDSANGGVANDELTGTVTEDGVRKLKVRPLSGLSAFPAIEKALGQRGMRISFDGVTINSPSVLSLSQEAQATFDGTGGALTVTVYDGGDNPVAALALWNEDCVYSHDAKNGNEAIGKSRQRYMAERGLVEAFIREVESQVPATAAPATPTPVTPTDAAQAKDTGSRANEEAFIAKVAEKLQDEGIALGYERVVGSTYALTASKGDKSLPCSLNMRTLSFTTLPGGTTSNYDKASKGGKGLPCSPNMRTLSFTTLPGGTSSYDKASQLARALISAIVGDLSEDNSRTEDSAQGDAYMAESELKAFKQALLPVSGAVEDVKGTLEAVQGLMRDEGSVDAAVQADVSRMIGQTKSAASRVRNAVMGIIDHGKAKIEELGNSGLPPDVVAPLVAAYNGSITSLADSLAALVVGSDALETEFAAAGQVRRNITYLRNLAEAQRGLKDSIDARVAYIGDRADKLAAEKAYSDLCEDILSADTNADSAKTTYDESLAECGNVPAVESLLAELGQLRDEICAVSVGAANTKAEVELVVAQKASVPDAAPAAAAAAASAAPAVSIDTAIKEFMELNGTMVDNGVDQSLRDLLGVA